MKNGQLHLVSGARIKSIENGDGQGNTYTTSYTYLKTLSEGSGILFRKPSYTIYVIRGNTTMVARRYSHSYAELWDVNGAHLGYSRVEEASTNSGKVVYSFTNYDTNPDPALGGDAQADGPPFAPAASFFWERGNPLNVAVYNQQGQLLTEERYEYTTNHPDKKQVNGSKSLGLSYQGCQGGSGSSTVTTTYYIISRPFTLRKKTVDLYDQENPGRKLTTVTEYGYDSNTYQLVSTTEYNAATPSEKHIVINKYITHSDYNYTNSALCNQQYMQCTPPGGVYNPFNDVCYNQYIHCLNNPSEVYSAPILIAKNRHMNSMLIEQQKWIDGSSGRALLGATLNLYKLTGSNPQIIVPAASMASEKIPITSIYQSSQINSAGTFIIPASFKNTGSFDTYDPATGKLLQATSRDGLVAQYTYDDNRTVIKTATVNPGVGGQTTAYEYKPLVGVTKQTDANGQFVTREYDALGRLRLLRDQNGHIRERYRYHYANETPSFLMDVHPRQVLANQPIYFSVSDLFVSTGGTHQISWNMGNGTVFNDNRQYFSFIYTMAGTYTVTATLTSNEYAPVSRSLTVTIGGPLSATVCIDGPVYMDLCRIRSTYFGDCTQLNYGQYGTSELIAKVVPGTGCGDRYTYYWEWLTDDYPFWRYLGNSQRVTSYHNTSTAGTTRFRCIITDVCGTSTEASANISTYLSCDRYPYHIKEETEADAPHPPDAGPEDPGKTPDGHSDE